MNKMLEFSIFINKTSFQKYFFNFRILFVRRAVMPNQHPPRVGFAEHLLEYQVILMIWGALNLTIRLPHS